MYIPRLSSDTTAHRQNRLHLVTGVFLNILLVTLFFGGFVQPVVASDTVETEEVTAEILVGLRNTEANSDQLRAAAIGAELALLNLAGEVTNVEAHDTRGTAFVSCDDQSVAGLRLTVATDDPDAAAAALAQHPEVLFAVPNAPVYAADRLFDQTEASVHAALGFEIEDPLYPEQQWYMEQVNAAEALGQVIAANDTGASAAVAPVVVAVIDSGIDADHPEFTGRLQQGYNFLSPTELPIDDYGHGTHVAGLIGAAVNNGLGIAGIAPNVTILSYKTLDQGGGGTIDNVVKAICRAVDEGADIINLSLTSPSQNTSQYTAAFDYARDRGVMMIAAAGNSKQTRNMWPARLDDVMAIAATNEEGMLASYSSPGDSIDMAAPGGEFDVPLVSTWPSNVACNGVNPIPDDAGGAYCTSIGTSMSAALVSGVAAILKGFHPEATADDIRTMLKDTAQPVEESVESVGAGILNAEKAVAGAMSSRLVVSPVFDTRSVPFASPPYDIPITVANPSFEVLEWSIAEPSMPWVSLSANDGATRFGSIGEFTITVRPQDLEPGNYGTPLTIVGKRPDGSLLFQNIQLLLNVDSEYDEKGQLVVSREPSVPEWIEEDSELSVATTVEFTNVGQEELAWDDVTIEVESKLGEPWLQWVQSAPIVSTLPFLDSVQFQLEVLPQNATLGENEATVTLTAKRSDGTLASISTEITTNIVPNTMLPIFIIE